MKKISRIFQLQITVILLCAALFFLCDLAYAEKSDQEDIDPFLFEAVFGDSKETGALPVNVAPKLYWAQSYSLNDFKADYPWIADHYFREYRGRVLNRWQKNVVISWGLPNNLKALNTGKTDQVFFFYSKGIQSPLNTEMKNVLSEEVAYVGEALKSDFPFKISIIDEAKEDSANFRIVFFDDGYWGNSYKNGNQSMGSSSVGFPKGVYFSSVEELNSVVLFTPNLQTQVNGYYTANLNGNIDFAVCYIPAKESIVQIRNYLRECLIRGLGLPHPLLNKDASILSAWGRSDNLISITYREQKMVRRVYGRDLKSGLDKQRTEEILSKR